MLRQLVRRYSYALLAIPAACQVAIILWAIWERTAHVPYWDEWDAAVLLRHAVQGRLGPGELWAPHAGLHRIVVPRLIDLTIIALTGWNRQIEMTVDLLVAVLTGLLFFSVARRTVRTSTGLFAVTAVGSLLLFSLTQYADWFAPFQLAFIATVFGAALCMVALSRHRLGWRAFGLAGAGAFIASLSSFPGLMVWPAFLPLVLQHRDRRNALLWLGMTVEMWLVYLAGITVARGPAPPLTATLAGIRADIPGCAAGLSACHGIHAAGGDRRALRDR